MADTNTTRSESAIVEAVRTCYDEIAINDSSMVGDQDESELDTIIKSKIAEAVRFVYGNCDESLLDADDVAFYDEQVPSNTDKVVSVEVDTALGDWLRIVWAKLGSWNYALRDILHEGDEDAKYLYDTFCGPTYEKPALLMTRDSDGRKLQFFRGKEASEGSVIVKENVYIAYVSDIDTSSSSGYEINDKIYPAVIYYICGLVATTFGETSRAKEFFEIAVSMMGTVIKENNNS